MFNPTKGTSGLAPTVSNGGDSATKKEVPPVVKSKPPRPQSLCEPTHNLEKHEVSLIPFSVSSPHLGNVLFQGPARPNTTSNVSQRNVYQQDGPDLVHDTTRKVVEGIKILLEYAQANDHHGVQITCSKIYNEAQSMASKLLTLVRFRI